MIVHQCEQGSPEWLQLRAGVLTASEFRCMRERLKTGAKKGDFSSGAKDLAFRKAVERVSGEPLDEGFQTWQMRRGIEMEPEARREHEIQTGQCVVRAGFVTTDDRLFGASADGLIDEGGGAEYKCLVSPERLRNVLVEADFSDFTDQVQGCMWITGRKWWDLCFYCPALRASGRQLLCQRFARDDDYIEAMEVELLQFAGLVSTYERALRAPANDHQHDKDAA